MFHFSLSSGDEARRGPTVPFHCPACGARTRGELGESIDRARWLGIVPVLRLRSTWIACPECDARPAVLVPLDRAARMTPAELGAAIRWNASRLGRGLAGLSLATCLVPVLGVGVAAAATWLTRGTRDWAGSASVLSLTISGTLTACCLAVAFIPL